MSNVLGRELLDSAFHRLNDRLVYANAAPVHLVVCGGAALIATNLISRTTQDIDVLILLSPRPESGSDEFQFPPLLQQAVDEVARELDLAGNWLNFGPAPLHKFGLPAGLLDRCSRRRYGATLTVDFISRLDQVQFKIFAAMDPKQGLRHLNDLLALDPPPSEAEARQAVGWLLQREAGAPFKQKLKEVLDRIGHERVAETI